MWIWVVIGRERIRKSEEGSATMPRTLPLQPRPSAHLNVPHLLQHFDAVGDRERDGVACEGERLKVQAAQLPNRHERLNRIERQVQVAQLSQIAEPVEGLNGVSRTGRSV